VSVEFEYEINADDFASGMTLYQKKVGGFRYRLAYILIGTALILLPIVVRHNNGSEIDAPWFTIAFGIVFLCCGIATLFYSSRVRRTYGNSEIASQRYNAVLTENGVDVSGPNRHWQFGWTVVKIRAENETLFIFSDTSVVFIFAKRYLTSEQMAQVRQLGKL
jgi:hypothetical protein